MPACFRTRTALQAEILGLRHQLLVLQRTCPYQKSRLSRESLLRHGDKQFKPSYACNVP